MVVCAAFGGHVGGIGEREFEKAAKTGVAEVVAAGELRV